MNLACLQPDTAVEHRTRVLLWAMAGSHCPPEFYCPITLEIMEDPVILTETGVTYDKKSVEIWLSPHGPQRCPITRKRLSNSSYVPNKSVRTMIEDWKRENGIEVVSGHTIQCRCNLRVLQ